MGRHATLQARRLGGEQPRRCVHRRRRDLRSHLSHGESRVYVKNAPVWAQQAEESGTIQTKEGSTAYEARDYLVFNDAGGKDGYAMPREEFHSLYELPEK